jgi:hypothetical protein
MISKVRVTFALCIDITLLRRDLEYMWMKTIVEYFKELVEFCLENTNMNCKVHISYDIKKAHLVWVTSLHCLKNLSGQNPYTAIQNNNEGKAVPQLTYGGAGGEGV